MTLCKLTKLKVKKRHQLKILKCWTGSLLSYSCSLQQRKCETFPRFFLNFIADILKFNRIVDGKIKLCTINIIMLLLYIFSWGTGWGDRGYMYLRRNDDNRCGIASYASYPVI